ncbi:MAG: hypothetical protein LBN08_06795 [Lactobacillales bacterium]|jgi:hypothetical protein|nr:hypothetical protein [Lactobacillales bacterium]
METEKLAAYIELKDGEKYPFVYDEAGRFYVPSELKGNFFSFAKTSDAIGFDFGKARYYLVLDDGDDFLKKVQKIPNIGKLTPTTVEEIAKLTPIRVKKPVHAEVEENEILEAVSSEFIYNVDDFRDDKAFTAMREMNVNNLGFDNIFAFAYNYAVTNIRDKVSKLLIS